jgi:hypothetical protein
MQRMVGPPGALIDSIICTRLEKQSPTGLLAAVIAKGK